MTGWPGAGKGTLCQFLTQIPSVVCLGVSDLLRKYAEAHPEVAGKITGAMDKGLLVPIKFVWPAVQEGIQGAIENGHKFIFLDGFPRDEQQAKLVVSLRSSLSFNISFLWVDLVLSRTEAEKRIRNRIKEDRVAGRTPRVDDLPRQRKGRLDGHESRARQIAWVLSRLINSGALRKVEIDATVFPEEVFFFCLTEVLVPLGVEVPEDLLDGVLT